MKPATADAPSRPTEFRPGRGFDPAALAALFVLTLRQHVRGRRLLVLSFLFLLPAALAAITRFAPRPPSAGEMEFVFVLNFIPHALAPLAALLYAAGVIQDEVEEQTLTYLLLRPLPRWALYLTRLAATWLVTAALTGVFAALTYVVIFWGKPEFWGEVMPGRALRTAELLALAQVGYCALFGAIGLYTRRSLIAGLAYIVGFEGVLANIPMVVRQLTVMYYFRVLAVRWLNPAGSDGWNLDLKEAPDAARCVQTVLAASAVLALLGALMTARREFRVKTPEGS